MSYDPFEPKSEPALSIYRAFQNEATKRKGRSVEEWCAAEEDAVWREARDQAQKLRLRIVTIDEVRAAESSARGHVDYGSKWAIRVVERMHKEQP